MTAPCIGFLVACAVAPRPALLRDDWIKQGTTLVPAPYRRSSTGDLVLGVRLRRDYIEKSIGLIPEKTTAVLIVAPRSRTSGTPRQRHRVAGPYREPPALARVAAAHAAAVRPSGRSATRSGCGPSGNRWPRPPLPTVETRLSPWHCLPARRLPAPRRRGHAPPASRRTAESATASREGSSKPGPPMAVSGRHPRS